MVFLFSNSFLKYIKYVFLLMFIGGFILEGGTCESRALKSRNSHSISSSYSFWFSSIATFMNVTALAIVNDFLHCIMSSLESVSIAD